MPSPSRLAPLILLLTTACSTFGAVRSAEVRPGLSASAAVAASGSVGDVAGWFWADECVSQCDRDVLGLDAAVTLASQRRGASPALALSIGTSGTHPYVEGYAQLGAGRTPFGAGARIGVGPWREHELFARIDVPLKGRSRLLLNPALFVHEGRSPNGAMSGNFVGFVQGVGLEYDAGYVSFTPAVSLVGGRARYGGDAGQFGPQWSMFPVATLGVSVGGRKAQNAER